jgi:hypothetical protein
MDKSIITLLTIILHIGLYAVIILYYPFKIIVWCWKHIRHLDPRYLYCRIKHGKPILYKYWELNPFGMGGGYNKYYSSCPVCKRKHWELNLEEYKNMETK